eukprot:1816940-Pleurochrysis_carterae.AAC.1
MGVENFLLARPHDGDAIVRGRLESERWLLAMIVIGATNPRFYASKRPTPHRTRSVETPPADVY